MVATVGTPPEVAVAMGMFDVAKGGVAWRPAARVWLMIDWGEGAAAMGRGEGVAGLGVIGVAGGERGLSSSLNSSFVVERRSFLLERFFFASSPVVKNMIMFKLYRICYFDCIFL